MSHMSHMERTERIAGLLDDLSVEDLRRTALQAIDHAHKSAAEVAEAHARWANEASLVAQLMDENARLRARTTDRALVASVARRFWIGRALLAVRRSLLARP